MDLVFGIFILALGAFTVLYLSAALLGAAVPQVKRKLSGQAGQWLSPKSWLANSQLARCERLLPTIDEKLKATDTDAVYELIQQAFFFSYQSIDEPLVHRIGAHHGLLVKRIASLARTQSAAHEALPLLDDLIASRTVLLRSLVEVTRKRRSLKAPGWAKEEYAKKLTELVDRLQTNERAIQSQIDQLFTRTLRGPAAPDQQYH